MNVYTEEDMTPWFPGTVAPEREGVYEREYTAHYAPNTFSLFFEGVWFRGHHMASSAALEGFPSTYLDDEFEWRGLARNPNVVTITPEVAVVKCNVPGLALDSGEFIPAAELNAQAAVDDEEQLF
jgi:hypothetical protein